MAQTRIVKAAGRPRLASPGGFTLIELLVTVSIIAVLTGLLLPAAGLIRERSRRTEAAMVVGQLVISMETYSNEHRRHEYPLQTQLYPSATIAVPHPISLNAQGSAIAGVLTELIGTDAVNLGNGHRDPEGCMIDPWQRRYRYQLTRPMPAQPAEALRDWNWDKDLARPKRWNDRTDSAEPFPYVWSLGRSADEGDATTWIYDSKS